MQYTKEEVTSMLSCTMNSGLSFTTDTKATSYPGNYIAGDLAPTTKMTAWDYYTNWYYPYVVKESYPVYIQERAVDKGKQAFEILKALQDKKYFKFNQVKDFIDAMDTILKTL